MLKKSALRKITTSTLAFIIVCILCLFPKYNNKLNIKTNIEYVDIKKIPIFLKDNNSNYIARTNIVITSDEAINRAKELIEILTVKTEKSQYIPNFFSPIIPENTKIISISLDKGLLKVNFSKEFLNIKKEDEIKLIEALTYTLTEDSNINGIMLFIENEKLNILPQSKIMLPNVLKRDFGINKVYNITNLKNISKTTIYYVSRNNDLTYYIPITKVENNNKNKIEVIIKELKSSPIYETNLMSYLKSSVELIDYQALENQISLSFNNAILSGIDNFFIEEEVKYSIALSAKDSLGIDEVIFKVNDKIIDKI